MQRKNYTKKIVFPNGSRLKIGVVASLFNRDITDQMLEGALKTLHACKVKNPTVLRVPGSFEIPFGCLTLLRQKKFDALVTIGCIIKGETDHNAYIASAASDGIMRLSLSSGIPIAFGIITTNNYRQALVRSRGMTNKGVEAALASVTMALLNA